MSFRNDTQRGRVCAALTSWIRGAPFFVADDAGIARPTDAAFDIAEAGQGRSGSEIAMLRIALCVWNGRAEEPGAFAAALYSLDRGNLTKLGALLIAIAAPSESKAMDVWLLAHEQERSS